MSYFPSERPQGVPLQSPKTSASSNPLLKVSGVLLSLISMILAIVGCFAHSSILSLVFSVLVGIFGLRVFVLWLGANQQQAPSRRTAAIHPSSSIHSELQATVATNSPPAYQPAFTPPQPVYAQAPTFIEQGDYVRLQQPAYAPPSSYPLQLQPAYASQSSYVHSQSLADYEARQPQESLSTSPYVPIDQDPIFELDYPGANERCFFLSKEGEPLVECQDRYALNADRHCYAVADGVAGSFVPGPWARIIAKGFVERSGQFASKEIFQQWLVECSQQWHMWIEQHWLPTMNAMRQQNGDMPGDWSNDIRHGAQTTLIGCTLCPSTQSQDVSTQVNVFAIGDGECFLFSCNTDGKWEMEGAFPFSDPNEFGSRPDTLVTVTRSDLLDRAWMQRKMATVNAQPGDLLVLATDTLAKWLLTQVQQNTDKWVPLLTNTSTDVFEQYIRQEFKRGQIEDDDLTLLIIPISLSQGTTSL